MTASQPSNKYGGCPRPGRSARAVSCRIVLVLLLVVENPTNRGREGEGGSSDEFQLNWNVDVAFILGGGQKFADSRASNLTTISSKLIHVHADELTGKV